MKKSLLIAATFGLFAVVSCKKAEQSGSGTDPVTTSLNSVTVPAGFDWASTTTASISVKSTDARFGTAIQSISVYDSDPTAAVIKPIATGSVSTSANFSAKVTVAKLITQLYVVKTAPDKSTLTQKVAVSGSMSLTFGATDPAYAIAQTTNKKVQATSPASPSCAGGCTVTVTQSTSNIDLNNGDVMCVTGDNLTLNFRNVNGGIIHICGSNVTVQNLNLAGSTTLMVLSGGSANLSAINFNSSAASVINWGTINYSGAFPDNGIFSNYGIFTCGSDFNLNGQAGVFTNNGILTIGGSFQDGTSAVATNNGSMSVGGQFQPNSNSAFVNNCSLTVGGDYNQSSGVKNYSYIKVGGTSTINGNSELGLYNGAMLSTKDLIVDGTIKGYGSTSLVKITGSTNIRNQGSVVSNVQVYATNTAIDNSSSGKINNGATKDNSVYIPKDGCNGEGNGSPTIVDNDGDGVADNLDAYPNDPTKAYDVVGASGTVAYEDQWPLKGDFDLNDVVMGYSYTLVTNAANAVVSVSGNYTLYATGGNFGNAFGIEFPVSKSLVSGLVVTNGGTTVSSPAFESGQTNAVVILFSNMRSEMSTWNTKLTDIFAPYKSYTISFNVANGPALSAFGQDEYNPFIYNSGRGHEVHVAGKTPTSLADQTLFGTADDNTNVAASRYYVTKAGLPYAINVPVKPFSYPVESIDITQAYLHIGDWAASGGTQYTDWYSNTGSGYRNSANIYTH